MAAVSLRPRLMRGALVALLLAIAGCSLVAPVQTPADRSERAQRLARDGRHADAARAYADLAGLSPADHDYYELESADQWLAAGNPAEARIALGSTSPEARAKLPTLRAMVAAGLALAENDGARAIRELDQIPAPQTASEAQQYWALRGNAAFLTGHPVEGTRAYLERERWLTDTAALRGSRQELYARLRAAAEHGNSLKAPANADGILAGWLELAPVAVELSRNPMGAAAALANWRRRYPQHPANDSVLAGAQTELAGTTAFPDQIALLLPLSGRTEPVGIAVRDGFIAAYLETDAASRPRLRIYDVAAESAAGAYTKAIEDGAGFVVGPLTKEDVAAVAPLTAGHAPLLALNFLGDSTTAPRNMYQFALLPEDEARMVARRAVADGRLKGVAIVPDGEWGTRVIGAFAEELQQLGGTLLEAQRYEAARSDFSDIIHRVLQIHDVKGEPSTHRTDAAFVFVAGTAAAARQILPQLKFHYAGDVPVYATSDSFEPDSAANDDVEGMLFPDMPWMISADPVTSQIRDEVRGAWPARTARRDRLYAFGFDAYRLVPALKSGAVKDNAGVSGMSGRLRLDEHGRVRRELDWAQIKSGVPAGL